MIKLLKCFNKDKVHDSWTVFAYKMHKRLLKMRDVSTDQDTVAVNHAYLNGAFKASPGARKALGNLKNQRSDEYKKMKDGWRKFCDSEEGLLLLLYLTDESHLFTLGDLNSINGETLMFIEGKRAIVRFLLSIS